MSKRERAAKRGPGAPPRRIPEHWKQAPAENTPATATPPGREERRPARRSEPTGGAKVILGSAMERERSLARRPIRESDIRRHRLKLAAYLIAALLFFGWALWLIVSASAQAAETGEAGNPIFASIGAGVLGFIGAYCLGQGWRLLRQGPRAPAATKSRGRR